MTERYSRALLQMAAAQLAKSVGFGRATGSSVRLLADVMYLYLASLARNCVAAANLSGRSGKDATDVDLHMALAELRVSLDDLLAWNDQTDIVTLPKITLLAYPVESILPPIPRLLDTSTEGDGVPRELPNAYPYLPALPPPHTFVATPVYPHEPPTAEQLAAEQSKARRRIVRSLSSLEHALTEKTEMLLDPAVAPGEAFPTIDAARLRLPNLLAPSTAPHDAGENAFLSGDRGDPAVQ